jgi:hypothetical protein
MVRGQMKPRMSRKRRKQLQSIAIVRGERRQKQGTNQNVLTEREATWSGRLSHEQFKRNVTNKRGQVSAMVI